jgi:DNA mismatch repair protein MutS2
MPLTDERSLEVLDFARIRDLVAGQTHSAAAFAAAHAMLPAERFVDVVRLQTETREMRALDEAASVSIARVEPVEDAVASLARGVAATALELRQIADALAAGAAAVKRIRDAGTVPALDALSAGFRALPLIVEAIDDAIGERGDVLDRASTELARVRRAISNAQDEARDRANAIARSDRRGVQDAIVTVREGRYVVPVRAEFASEFGGIVHDASASGQTLFIEPIETLEANNRLRALRAQESHEVLRIIQALSDRTGAEAAQIAANLVVFHDLDLVLAKARVARAMHATAPELSLDARVDVKDGRHPLLGERAVPQSLVLDATILLLLISGPNMGGKTVALKMVGLYVAMTYCGMHLPSGEGTTIGTFTHIFTDIGDEQSIAMNASTFSAHLRRLSEIVRDCDDRSLVLVDEIGSGTEPAAGAALAVAMLERFIDRGARTIATTHATELKLFGAKHKHVKNASVRFDPTTYQPTYQLDIGSPGQSLAFNLARHLEMDMAVLDRAASVLSTQERDYDKALEELATERNRLAAERRNVESDRTRLWAQEENVRFRSDALDREKREFARTAEQRLSNALRQFAAELERRQADRPGRAKVTAGQATLLGNTVEKLNADLGLDAKGEPAKRPAADRNAKPLKIGDTVYIVSMDREGVIADDAGSDWLVTFGAMNMRVSKRDVRRPGDRPPPPRPAATPPAAADRPVRAFKDRRPQAAQAQRRPQANAGGQPRRTESDDDAETPRSNGLGGGAPRLEAATYTRSELDVRGKRFSEAQPLVERWIDDSHLAGVSPLRLIHGKGTGLLGRGLQEWLKDYDRVTSVRYGNEDEGGSGVTFLELV